MPIVSAGCLEGHTLTSGDCLVLAHLPPLTAIGVTVCPHALAAVRGGSTPRGPGTVAATPAVNERMKRKAVLPITTRSSGPAAAGRPSAPMRRTPVDAWASKGDVVDLT